VQADSGIEWQQNDKLYIARGNAVATRGPAAVHADTLIAHYRDVKGGGSTGNVGANASANAGGNTGGNTEIYRVEAEGNVTMTREGQTVVGDRAVYDLDQALMVVTGKALKLTTATDVVTARDTLEWYEQKQVAVGRGNAVAVRNGKTIKADILTAYMVKSKPADSKTPARPAKAPPAQSGKPSPTPAAAPAGSGAAPAATESKISRVDAQGHVVVTNATDTGRGDYGVYNADTGICTLVDNVVIARGKDVIKGQYGPVAAGQVMFVIDDRDFAAKVAQAEAVLATEEASVVTYASRLKLQQAMIDQAAANVRSAEADLNRAQLDFKRYTTLATSDYASRQRYESADADSRKAEAALGKARAAFAAEQNQLAVFESQKREEEAKLLQGRAALQLAKNDLDSTMIRAPIDGIAGNRAGQIGQYVKAGTQLLSLVPLPRVYVTANFKETQLTRMRPGQPAEISVDAYPDQPLHGQVESFAPGSGAQFSLLPPDNATGNFTKVVQRVPVRIAVPADGPLARLLRPGLSVTVTIDTRREGTAETAEGIVGAAHAGPASPEGRRSP
jgi:membrane fusion protein (multidrug efflux system)